MEYPPDQHFWPKTQTLANFKELKSSKVCSVTIYRLKLKTKLTETHLEKIHQIIGKVYKITHSTQKLFKSNLQCAELFEGNIVQL